MRFKINKEEVIFKPIKIEIEIESKVELEAFLTRLNPGMEVLLNKTKSKLDTGVFSDRELIQADRTNRLFYDLKTVWLSLR